jgi:F-type H+-transporting ATPase subunit b
MIQIDASIFAQVANFVFLIVVLNAVLYKPIRKILLQRKEKVNGLENNIETFTKDADEKDVSYLAGIKEARFEGLREKETLLQSASDEEKLIIEKINQKAQADLEAVREKITKEAEGVRANLLTEIDSFADAIKQKILGEAF